MSVWPEDDPTGTLASEDPEACYEVEAREYTSGAALDGPRHDRLEAKAFEEATAADTWLDELDQIF